MSVQKVQKSPPGVDLMQLWQSWRQLFSGKIPKITGRVFENKYAITYFFKKIVLPEIVPPDKQSEIVTSKLEDFYQKFQKLWSKAEKIHRKTFQKTQKLSFVPVECTLINLMDSFSQKTKSCVISCETFETINYFLKRM